jgi:hypothetical protein
MKKVRKQMAGIVGTSLFLSGSSLGLSAIRGTVAAHGLQGISGMSKIMPAMGSLAGYGMLARQLGGINKMGKKKKK